MLPAEAAVLLTGTAAVAALIAVHVATRIARRTGFLDRPVDYKSHGGHPTPYLGGSAVLGAFVVAALAYGDGAGRFLAVLMGAVGLWAVGTLDDRVNLSPWLRITATVAAATGLWVGDLGWNVFAGSGLNLALTVTWVLGLVNAFNLMDNMGGACGSVAAAAVLAIGAFAIEQGDVMLASMAFGLAGSCLAFLRSNLARPARIFLGDGGSMPVGFIVAAMAIAATSEGELGQGAVLAATMMVGLAILYTTLVSISRRRHGVPLLTGERDHMAHRLLGLVGTPRHVAGTLAIVQLPGRAGARRGKLRAPGDAVIAAAAAVIAVIVAITFLEKHMARLYAQAASSGALAPARGE